MALDIYSEAIPHLDPRLPIDRRALASLEREIVRAENNIMRHDHRCSHTAAD